MRTKGYAFNFFSPFSLCLNLEGHNEWQLLFFLRLIDMQDKYLREGNFFLASSFTVLVSDLSSLVTFVSLNISHHSATPLARYLMNISSLIHASTTQQGQI